MPCPTFVYAAFTLVTDKTTRILIHATNGVYSGIWSGKCCVALGDVPGIVAYESAHIAFTMNLAGGMAVCNRAGRTLASNKATNFVCGALYRAGSR